MIDINSIIHLENKAFDIEKDIALLCIKDYQREANSFQLKENEIYSVAFIMSVDGLNLTKQSNIFYKLKCTKAKHHFKIIEAKNIQTPIVNLQDLSKKQNKNNEIQNDISNSIMNITENNLEKIIQTKYRFEKRRKPFKVGDIQTENDIKEAGFDIEKLLNEEAITWLK